MYYARGIGVCRDVPWMTQEEQGFGPLHPEVLRVSNYPPPHLPGVLGTMFTSNLGPGWTGSYHTKEGFQVSKGEWKGELKRN
jgi:hypothetical protein